MKKGQRQPPKARLLEIIEFLTDKDPDTEVGDPRMTIVLADEFCELNSEFGRRGRDLALLVTVKEEKLHDEDSEILDPFGDWEAAAVGNAEGDDVGDHGSGELPALDAGVAESSFAPPPPSE